MTALPPEVRGCLSVAVQHLRSVADAGPRKRKDRHMSKVQKLISKANRYLSRRAPR